MKTGFFHLTEDDREMLVGHFLRLSPADRRLRFGMALRPEALETWCRNLDLTHVAGFFRFGDLVAVMFLTPETPQRSEFAISVDQEHRSAGLAGRLLAIAVEDTGVDQLVIRHATSNTAMAKVHRAYPSRKTYDMGDVDVEIDIRGIRAEQMQAYGLACGAET